MTKEKSYMEKKCKICGKKFAIKRFWQKYCSKKCGWKAWDLKHPRAK
jgi:hypothetical protein